MVLVNYTNEFKTLRSAALYRPSLEEISSDTDKSMYLDRPDPIKVLKEVDGIVDKLRSFKVDVTVLEGNAMQSLTTNMIYLRDVAFVFRDKIVVGNMRHKIRQTEPEKFKQLIIAKNREFTEHIIDLDDTVFMEGADLLVSDEHKVNIYEGHRTSVGTSNELKDVFPNTTFQSITATINDVPQHILGAMHVVDSNLAIRRPAYTTDELEDRSFIDLKENDEIRAGLALNIITLGPSEILMPSGNPLTKATLESAGITCHEVLIDEIHKMGGGLACMLLPLVRDKQ